MNKFKVITNHLVLLAVLIADVLVSDVVHVCNRKC